MSRCFPFPPPGYEKKAKTEDVDLLKKVHLLSFIHLLSIIGVGLIRCYEIILLLVYSTKL